MAPRATGSPASVVESGPAGTEGGAAMRWTTCVTLGWILLGSTASAGKDHLKNVEEYALIVGDAAIAGRRCDGVADD